MFVAFKLVYHVTKILVMCISFADATKILMHTLHVKETWQGITMNQMDQD